MSFQDELMTLAQRVGRMAVDLLNTPGLDGATREQLTALLIAQGNAEAYALGQISLELLETVLQAEGVLTAVSSSPKGMARFASDQNDGKILQAVQTALSEPETAVMRVERLARSEVLNAGQDALHDGIQEMDGVVGWERDLEGDACELCKWWRRDGRVWPTDHTMPTHPGCGCTQKPVYGTQYAGEVEPVGLARQRWQYHNKKRNQGA